MSSKKEASDRVRAFIAVGLPGAIVSKLKDLQLDLGGYGLRVRWTRPENIHLTLRFLGEVNRSWISKVCDALARSVNGFQPMALSVQGIGVFPGVKRPRVLWAGISGQADELRRLQADLDRSLHELGFPPEKRSYTGHLTLGRFKDRHDPDRLFEMISAFHQAASAPFTVDAVTLYQSRLYPSGPVYTKLFTAGLKGQDGA